LTELPGLNMEIERTKQKKNIRN